MMIEPSAPPPGAAAALVEPDVAPPPMVVPYGVSMEMEGNGDMASEAADWFSQAFRLQLCGKQLDSKGAKNLLIGAGVLVTILVVIVVAQASGSEQPSGTEGPVPPLNTAAPPGPPVVITAPPALSGLPTSVIVASVGVTPSAVRMPGFAAHFREDLAGSIGVDPSMITMPRVLSGSPTQELARYRPTRSSSVYGNGVAAPRNAVDGSTDNFYPNIFQSDGPGSAASPEWFAVELEASTSNPAVTVWARDCCTAAFRNQLRVSIGPAGSSLADAAACGDVTLQDAGQQSTQCAGTGSVIFLSAALGGSVQLAEVSVNGVLDTSGVPLGFNVAVGATQIDQIVQSLEAGSAAFGNSASALAPGSSVRLTTHDIVRYSAQFTCSTALEDCPRNSNCVDNVDTGFYCECALDFTGPRPACAALSPGGTSPGAISAGTSGSVGPGSHIILQTSGHTYVRAALDGTVNQVEVPTTGLPDDWLFETFTLRDAGQGTVALQTHHNTFIQASGDSTIRQTDEVPAEALTLLDRDALPSNWEWCRFTVVPAGDGQVAFLTFHNTFLRAPNGDTIDQSSPAPGDASQGPPLSWQQERFMVTVVDPADLLVPAGRVVTIAGAGGSMCAAALDSATGIGAMTVSSATPLPDECQFTVIGGADGRISLQTSFGSYVRAPAQGRAELDHSLSGRDVALQRFTVVDAGNGAVALQTARGTFLSVAASVVVESPGVARLTVLDVGSPSACGADEFLAEFFSNVQLSQSPTAVLCESSIDRQWGYGGVPELQGQTDHFSVRWSGSFSFPAPSGTVGSWEFQSTADDGSRLYVDNNLIIDKWSACCTTWTSEPQDLDSSIRHSIVYEMMESDGAAFAVLDWSFAGCGTDNFLVEYFDNVYLAGAPVYVGCSTGSIAQSWDERTGVPELGGRATNFAVRWTGMVSFAESGSYQFTSQSDDGSRVFVDGDLVLDKWAESGNMWRSSPVIVRSPQSSHSIIYEVVQYSGGASASLSWDKGTDHCEQDQFWAQYFASPDMSGAATAALTTCQASISIDAYDWAQGAPLELPGRTDHFSVRWMGEMAIPPGSYAFISHSDDGSRVYVNGNLVLDRWGSCCATWASDPVYVGGEVALTSIVYDFREDGGFAYADLTWEPRTCEEGFQAVYFDNEELAGSPVASSCDSYPLDHHWDDSGVPEMGGIADHFSVRWTGSFDFNGQYYSFTSTSDDGSRIRVNGASVLDRWSSSAATSTSEPIRLSGLANVDYELVQHSGDARATMFWGEVLCSTSSGGGGPRSCAGVDEDSLTCPPGSWKATYYDNEAHISPAQYAACEQNIHRQWIGQGVGLAQLGGQSDHFSIRWVGQFDFGGSYQFQTRSDDGSRLFVDSTLVLDKWRTCCSTWTSDTVDIPGTALLTFELVNYGPGAYADLTWINNGCGSGSFRVEYYSTQDLSGAPLDNDDLCFTPEEVGLINGAPVLNWHGDSPDIYGLQADHFSIRWSGEFEFTYGQSQAPGMYEFTVASDDGSRLIVDGVTVLDQWGSCCQAWNSEPVFMSAGTHLIVYEYNEIGGDAYAGLTWHASGCDIGVFGVSFFDNPNFQGTPVNGQNQCEPASPDGPPCTPSSCTPVNRNWQRGGVDELLGQQDQFSVRWEGTFEFEDGDYIFSSTSDDGSRVNVDGVLVLDRFSACCATWTSDPIHLSSGLHAVSYEMQELGGEAYATLMWSRSEANAGEGIRFSPIRFESRQCDLGRYPRNGVLDEAVQYFNSCDAPDNSNYCSRSLTSGERLSNQDVCRTGSTNNIGFHIAVDFTVNIPGLWRFRFFVDWGLGGFAGLDNALDYHAQRWDHVLIEAILGAGPHSFEAYGFEDCCDGHSEFEVLLPDGCAAQHQTCAYASPIGPSADEVSSYMAAVANDPAAQATGGSYIPGCSTDCLQFTALADAQNACNVESSCGGLTYENHPGQQVCCDNDGPNAGMCGWCYELRAGSVTNNSPYGETSWLKTDCVPSDEEQYLDVFSDTVELYVCEEAACQVGQFEAQYFDNSELSGAPVYSVCENEINKDWGRAGVPELGGRGDHFSVRWNGRHLFDPSGNWIFTSRSNDGSRVYVDGLLILDRLDELNGNTWLSDPQPLLGWHEVSYEFVNFGGNANAQLTWDFEEAVDMTQSCTYDGPTGPSAQQLADFDRDGTHEGGFYIPGCSANCVQFSSLESAQFACSVEDTCGGITYEFHSGDAGTILCCDNDGPHAGICGWCFELRHGAAPDGVSTMNASPNGEFSWLKQGCRSDVDGQLACQGWGPDNAAYPIVATTVNAGSHLGNAASDHIYRLTIDALTVVTVDTCGSSYDTYIRIYDEHLSTEITACDDCGPCGVQTVLDAQLGAGVYMVVIEGFSGSEGEYTLEVACANPADHLTITCEQTVTGTTEGAQNIHGGGSGEHLFDFHLPDAVNFVQFDSCESSFDTYLRVFSADMSEELEGCDDCGDCGLHSILDTVLPGGDYTLVVEGFSASEGEYNVVMHCPSAEGFVDGEISCGETKTGTTVDAGSHVGNGASDHVYHFTTRRGDTVLQFDACASEFDTHLRILDETMTEVAGCDDCGPCGLQTLLDTVVSCDADECHFNLVVEGFSSNEGAYSVSMNCPPANYRPRPITCDGAPATGTTVGAGSTYLAFTITDQSQLVQFDSCASTFDTYLMVMEADTRHVVQQCDNCGDCGDRTVLDLMLDPGDYLLAIEGADRVEGEFSIAMSCPPNNFQDGELSCGSDPVTGNTMGAEDLHVGNEGGDHVFEFTLTETQLVSISSCGSEFDTHLRVLNPDLSPLTWCEGNACDCDDCGPCGVQSVLPYTQYPAGNYALVVSGFSTSHGLYTVDMQCIDGLITCGGQSATGRYDGSPKQFMFTIAPGSSGVVQFDSCRSDYDTLLRIMTLDQETELSSCDDCGSCGSQAVLDASLPAGDYVLVVEGYGASSGNYDIAMNCDEQLNAIPVTAQSEGDGGEENLNDHTVSISSDDLELTFDGVQPQLVGVRFSNVQMMPGSTVSEAHITFTIDEVNPQSNMPVTLSITAEAAGDSSLIEPEASNLSGRARIDSSIEWQPEGGLLARASLQTPDVSSLLSEVADQPGWQPGNAVLFIISRVDGQGVRWAVSVGAGAPTLTYTYLSDGFTDGAIYCGATVHGSTVGAGQHVGNGASDHIYSFHVPPSRAGMIQFDSCGSTFDTWIRVMSHHMSQEIASCDDCGPCGIQSVVEVELEPGDYVVVLEGFAVNEGDYQLAMNCFGGGREGTISCGETVTGTTQGVASSIGNGGGEHFYSFTLASMPNSLGVEIDQLVQFDSCASSYDTYLRVFSIDLDEEMQSCDDCGDCGLQTVLDAVLTAGEYVLVIEGFSSAEGEYSVTMNCPTLADEDSFLDGSIACGDTVRGTTVEAGSHIGNGASDHVYTFSLPSSDGSQTVQFDSCDSEFDTYLRVTRGNIHGAELAACDDCGPCGLHTVLDAVLECDATQPNYSPEGDTCEYNLVIEGFSSNEGVYAVTMNCDSEMDGAIACGETVSGSTVGAGSHVGNGASDHFYAFSLDRSSNIQMDSCASSYDTFLRIFDMSLGEEYTSCDDCGNCGTRTVLDAQLEAGDYVLVIEGYAESEGEYSVTMNCPDQAGGINLPITESVAVADTDDTAEEQVSSGSVVTDSRDLELSFDSRWGEQVVGVRFEGVNIAQGAVVAEAVVDFTVSQISALAQQEISVTIKMELAGDAAAITETSRDLSRRPTTSSEARWSPEISLVQYDTLSTANFNHVMSEVVAQPTWSPGNSVMLFFTYLSGQGNRWVKSGAGADAGVSWPAPTLRYTYFETGFADGAIRCGDTVRGTTDGAGTHVGNGASDHVYTFDVTPDMIDREHSLASLTFDSCESEFDTYLRVFDVSLTEEITFCDDCGPCGLQAVLNSALPVGSYSLVIEGYGSNEGIYSVTMSCEPFSRDIEGTLECGRTVTGNTDGAGAGMVFASGHYYSFSLPTQGLVQFDSCDSDYDTFLRVFSANLDTELDSCDDCGDCGVQTVLDTDLPAGSYTLVIEGFADATGQYSVTMNCPTNGEFMDGAIECGQVVTGSTVSAVSSAGSDAGDHLYSFTTPQGSHLVQFDSCDSEFDTFLIIHEADPAAENGLGPEVLGCDDCGACGVQTVLDATLVCNDPQCSYFLVIEGYGGSEGEYNVAMNCGGDNPNLTIEGTLSCNGAPATGSTVGASSDTGTAAGDHLWSFSLDTQTLVQFDSCASSYDTFLRVTSPDLTTELSGCDDCGDCGTRTVLDADLPAGEYILIIEGYASTEGDYSVQMNCPTTTGVITGFTDGDIACGDSVVGTTIEAGSHVGNGASDHIYSFSLSEDQAGFVQFDSCASDFDTYLRVYNSDLTSEITGCDDCGPCGVRTVLDAQLPAGDYNLVIEGYSTTEGTYDVAMICSAETGTSSTQGTIACAQTVAGSTEGAGNALGNAGGEHLYSFTVPDGLLHNFIQFDSCDSTYDTYLRIMSTDLAEERHGCDDCGDCGVQAVLDADLPPGDYILVVEGFASDEGSYSVIMNCDTANVGSFEPIACGATVIGVTDESTPSNMGNPSGEALYAFTLMTTQAVQFDSCESSFDTFLRIASPTLDQELIGCDDCGDCGTRTVLDAELPAGDYVLVVEGFNTDTGAYSVTMNCPDAGVFLDGHIECGDTVSGNTVGAGSHVGNGASDHVYSFSITSSMLGVTFDSCASEYDTYLRVLRGTQDTLAECVDLDNCPQEAAGCDDCGECGVQTVLTLDPVLDPATAALPEGEYLLIVEGFSSSEGVYTITMNCRNAGDPPPPPPSGAVACDAGDYLVDQGQVDKTGGYGHGHDCNWHLACSDPAASPLLVFTSFSTEANYDFVTIYDGDSNDAPQIGRFHGEDLPGGDQGLQSTGSNMLVRLTTDGSISREGFSATFECTRTRLPPPPPNPCLPPGLTLQGSATPQVLDGTAGYANNVVCDWRLSCQGGLAPLVVFQGFNTEANFDFVRVYDGSTNEDTRLANYNGNFVPDSVLGSSSDMLVEFTTDGSINRDGFMATFECSSVRAPPPAPDGCSGGLRLQTPGPIATPRDHYENGATCTWFLTCPVGMPLLQFTSFSTETNYDWVSVYDGASDADTMVAHASGDVPPDAVQATGQAITVVFTADSSVTRAGFTADFSCPTNAVVPPPPPDACTTGVTLVDGGGFSMTNYAHGGLCTWLLTCTNRAAAPLLGFSNFNTEAEYDFVTVYRGAEASEPNIVGGPWSGSSIPGAVAGDAGSSMLVEFTSDESVARDGFVASYSCTTEPVPPPPPSACVEPGATVVDSAVIDQSMYFQNGEDLATGVYTHNLECRWLLTCSDRTSSPTLTFRSFDTEANFDFVRAYDGADTNAPQLSPGQGWSGNDVPSNTQGTGAQVLLQFITDDSVSQHGWSASFACQPGQAPPAPPAPECSRLQLVARDQCQNDCAGCDFSNVNVVLGVCVDRGSVAREALQARCAATVPPPPPPPPPVAPGGLTGTVLAVAADATRGNTIRLVVSITGTRSNVYAMSGTSVSPMSFPAGYQVAAPFGVDIGGVNPAFFAVLPDSEFDSWLTIGITEGDTAGAMSSIGIAFTTWTATTGFGTSNGAVFYMDPTTGPSGDVVMAQITSVVASGSAHASLQGRATRGGDDWDATVNWSW